jgi:hypothetical protein
VTLPVPDASRDALAQLYIGVANGHFPAPTQVITAISTPVVAAVLRDLAGRAPEAVVEDWLVREAERVEAL